MPKKNSAVKFIVDANIVFSSILNVNGKIWSGDKALMKGLQKKNFNDFITTDELFKLRETTKEI